MKSNTAINNLKSVQKPGIENSKTIRTKTKIKSSDCMGSIGTKLYTPKFKPESKMIKSDLTEMKTAQKRSTEDKAETDNKKQKTVVPVENNE